MQHVLFRVDAESQMGTGHAMRCLALAQALNAEGVGVTFAMGQNALDWCQARQDWVGRGVAVPPAQRTDPAWCRRLMRAQKADWIVIDGYHFDQNFFKNLYETEKVVMFDDNNERSNNDADIIINGGSHAEKLGYERNSGAAKLCLGDKWRVLRAEFQNMDVSWKKRHRLLLSFGGSDPLNLSQSVLEALRDCHVTVPLTLVTGVAYGYHDALKTWLRRHQLQVEHWHACQSMAKLFAQTRLAVSAAGGTQFELQASATPSLLAIVADNQRGATQDAVQQGWCEAVSGEPHAMAEALARRALQLWHDEQKLQGMHQNALPHRQTDAAARVVALMRQLSGQRCMQEGGHAV